MSPQHTKRFGLHGVEQVEEETALYSAIQLGFEDVPGLAVS